MSTETLETAKLILLQIDHNRECGKADKFTIEEVNEIIERRVVKNNDLLHDLSGMFPALNTVRQEIEGYKEKTIQGDRGHFQNGINWAFNHISKQIKK